MTNLKAQSYPTDLGRPPTNRTDFLNECNTDRIDWTDGMKSATKGAVTPTYGVKTNMPSSNSYGAGNVIESVWQDNGNKGFRIDQLNSSAGQGNIEIGFDSKARWMTAGMFNGLAFELHSSQGGASAMYVTQYALIFVNAGVENYRFFGNTLNDGYNNGPHLGYRLADFNNETYINEIRSWGRDWLLQGIVLNIQNAHETTGPATIVKFWNLKIYHKCVGSTSANHRIFTPKLRSFSNRNRNNRRGIEFN